MELINNMPVEIIEKILSHVPDGILINIKSSNKFYEEVANNCIKKKKLEEECYMDRNCFFDIFKQRAGILSIPHIISQYEHHKVGNSNRLSYDSDNDENYISYEGGDGGGLLKYLFDACVRYGCYQTYTKLKNYDISYSAEEYYSIALLNGHIKIAEDIYDTRLRGKVRYMARGSIDMDEVALTYIYRLKKMLNERKIKKYGSLVRKILENVCKRIEYISINEAFVHLINHYQPNIDDRAYSIIYLKYPNILSKTNKEKLRFISPILLFKKKIYPDDDGLKMNVDVIIDNIKYTTMASFIEEKESILSNKSLRYDYSIGPFKRINYGEENALKTIINKLVEKFGSDEVFDMLITCVGYTYRSADNSIYVLKDMIDLVFENKTQLENYLINNYSKVKGQIGLVGRVIDLYVEMAEDDINIEVVNKYYSYMKYEILNKEDIINNLSAECLIHIIKDKGMMNIEKNKIMDVFTECHENEIKFITAGANKLFYKMVLEWIYTSCPKDYLMGYIDIISEIMSSTCYCSN
ncbi:Hypothetical protein ORPV_90 [Orpheovirus IHUMI-LCC2]|uniref:F-box domain-containing protein n=1 Tax=Orpheovirus IHUMI-LCC2 TaxID=2023057 RepID=A0A2I2L389_9VIRU|nr:Hypothetical protein ORPV_90 [Orpheovirus IHUMI-LCC2]SNW61994.1 Hypothetical protein ORPV_90 [Orpheovirus IHUMI-LCC2]